MFVGYERPCLTISCRMTAPHMLRHTVKPQPHQSLNSGSAASWISLLRKAGDSSPFVNLILHPHPSFLHAHRSFSQTYGDPHTLNIRPSFIMFRAQQNAFDDAVGNWHRFQSSRQILTSSQPRQLTKTLPLKTGNTYL